MGNRAVLDPQSRVTAAAEQISNELEQFPVFLIRESCDYLNDEWGSKSSLKLGFGYFPSKVAATDECVRQSALREEEARRTGMRHTTYQYYPEEVQPA